MLKGAGVEPTDACADLSPSSSFKQGNCRRQRPKKLAATTCIASWILVRKCQALTGCGAHTRPSALAALSDEILQRI
jgi:hypothetical protein